jgi:hypothetical protein
LICEHWLRAVPDHSSLTNGPAVPLNGGANFIPKVIGMTPEMIEGRLVAQRKLIAFLLARLPNPDAALGLLDDRETLQTGEEDPGALPDAGFQIASAVTDEYRLVREEMMRFLART